MRILIVDDDEHVAAGIRMALAMRGYEADAVRNRRGRRWNSCARGPGIW